MLPKVLVYQDVRSIRMEFAASQIPGGRPKVAREWGNGCALRDGAAPTGKSPRKAAIDHSEFDDYGQFSDWRHSRHKSRYDNVTLLRSAALLLVEKTPPYWEL